MENKGFVEQLTVFLENRIGTLQEVTSALGEANINIFSISLADTSEYGLLRMIVGEPARARQVLHDMGFAARLTNVVAVKLSNQVGTLAKLLNDIAEESIGIEYMYAMATSSDGAMILKTSDGEAAVKLLLSKKYDLMEEKTLFELK